MLGLLQIAPALAQQPAELVELAWSAPRGCPSAAEVRARVRALAGSAQVAAKELRAEATVARTADGLLHLHLVIHADRLVGVRDIDGKSCSDLAGATAVALALLLRSAAPLTSEDLTGSTPSDQSADGQPSSSSAGTRIFGLEAPSAASPAAATTSAGAPASARKERGWHGLLQVPLLLVGLGPLHRPSYGLGGAAGVSVGRWVGLAEGRVWLPQRTSAVHEAERYAADVQRFAVGLRGGHAFLWPRFQVVPCLSVSVEHLSARGTGPHIAASEAKATWIAVGLGVQARIKLVRWLNLLAGIELQVQTSRPKISIDGVGEIEQLLPVAGGFTLGTEWIL